MGMGALLSAASALPRPMEKLSDLPGKASHRHAGSVFAYVLSGAIRSENSATGPVKIYKAGESFFEPPVANISSARTQARQSPQACSPSSSPMTARSSRLSTSGR